MYDVVAMDLPIRVKHPDVLPFVGMFSDPLDVAKAVKPLTMQLEQEKIEEDAEEANVTKDADFYRQKAKRRRIFYSNKSVMKFEDTQSSRTEDGPPVGVQFEGVPWAPSTTSLTGEVKPMENRAVHIKGEDQAHAMNQYALLKVVKRVNNTTGKTDTEVDMIPLGGFYKFRKPAINRGQTLELVDDEFEEELARRKKSHAKYQAFVFKQPDEDDEEAAAVAATKAAAMKREAKSGFRLGTGLGLGGDNATANQARKDGKFELPQVFGLALQARKLKKGGNAKAYLDESGVALDQEQEADDTFKGDFDKSYANNDMAFADEGAEYAQHQQEEAFEHEREKMDYLDDDEDDGEPDEDDLDIGSDDDDDETAKKKAAKEPVSSGVVDDQVLYQARTAGRALTGAGGDTAGADRASRKRSQPSDTSAIDGEDANANETASKAKKSKLVMEASTSDKDLTEHEVRSFIQAHGGRVSVDSLKAHFKKQVRAMHKRAAGSGVAAITAIIKVVGRVTQDVMEGKVVVLK